jgi:hypothetical protein
MLERVKGIEPSSSAWKAVALPLSYTRVQRTDDGKLRSFDFCLLSSVYCPLLVGDVGLEPTRRKPADLQSCMFH